MNYKQKCHDIYYASDVVNKELSFGCLINNEMKYPLKYIGYDSGQHALLMEKDGQTPMLIVEKVKEEEIIGHPPTGFDWLRLIEKKYQITLQVMMGKTSIFLGQDHRNRIYFDLATGEPTDWEALYKIIS